MIAISLSSLLMTVTASWMAQSMRLAAQSRCHESSLMDWQRLSRQIRQDAAAASSRRVEDGRLIFTTSRGEIIYEIRDHVVTRRGPDHRETYLASNDRRTQWTHQDQRVVLRMGRVDPITHETRWTHRLILP